MKQKILSLIVAYTLVLSLLMLVPQPVRAQANILTLACTGNATTDTAALTAAKTSVGSTNPATIQIPMKATAARCKFNTVTVTPNITIDTTNSSGIFVVTGQTLSLPPNFIAPPNKQIFFNATAGLGSVTFTGGAPVLSPMWWGAKGDGSTDDLAAFDAAIASLNTNVSGENPAFYKQSAIINIPEPAVYYSLSNTWNIYRPVDIRGAGSNAGATTQPSVMLKWPAGVVGIKFHRYNSLPGFTGTQSDGASISGLKLKGTFSGNTGTADVSGLTVTRVTGDSYASDFNADYSINIGGYDYVVETRDAGGNSLTIYKPRLVVNATNGSAIVLHASGTTPGWPTTAWNGQAVKIEGVSYTISAVSYSTVTCASSTVPCLVLTVPYAGATDGEADGQVQALATATGATTILNKFHGIQVYAQITMHDLLVWGFSGNGINIDTSTVPSAAPGATDINANNSRIDRVMSYGNKGHGILTKGTNSNNLTITNFNGQNNRGAGIMDTSQLGITWIAPHLAENIFAPNFSNAVQNQSTFIGMYTEGGQPTSVGSALSISINGDQGAGWTKDNMGYVTGHNRVVTVGDGGYMLTTPLVQIRPQGNDNGTNPLTTTSYRIGNPVAAFSVFSAMGASNDSASTSGGFTSANPGPAMASIYCQAGSVLGTGHFAFGYNDLQCNDLSKQLIVTTGSAATEGSAHLEFPNGALMGWPYDSTAPSLLHVVHTSDGTTTVKVDEYGANAADIRFRRAQGTPTSPTAVQTNNVLGSITALGYGTSAFPTTPSGYMAFIANQAHTNSARGTDTVFFNTASGTTTLGEKARITGSGRLGIGTTTPGYAVDVVGDVNVTGNFKIAGVNIGSGNMTNPMTTTGDLIYGSTTGSPSTPSRLGVGTTGQVLTVSAGGIPEWGSGSGSGNVNGPGSSTDFALARYNGTTGTILRSSSTTLDNSGNLFNPGTFQNTGFVGINTVPANAFHVAHQSDGTATAKFDEYGANASQITFRRAAGTIATPTAVLTTNILGTIVAAGYGATGFSSPRAALTMVAAENWTDSAQGTNISFGTTSTGSTSLVERIRLTSAGFFGVNTSAPAVPLEVNGIARATVQDRGGAVFNCKANGAVGNNSTDDTAALNACFTAAAGNIAFIPAGIYITDNLTTPASGTLIVGAGMGVTTLKRKVNSTAGSIIGGLLGFTNTLTIKDLTIDGNCGTPTFPGSVYTCSNQATISESELLPANVANVLIDGVEIKNAGKQGILLYNADYLRVVNSKFTGFGSATVGPAFAIFSLETAGAGSIGMVVENSTFTDWKLNAIITDSNQEAIRNNVFIGNHRQTIASGGTGGGQIDIAATSGLLLEGPTISGNQFYVGGNTGGINTSCIETASTDYMIITGNRCDGGGVQNIGIVIQGGIHLAISGNMITGYLEGLHLDAATDYIAAVNNDFSGNTTPLINVSTGTNNHILGNLGAVERVSGDLAFASRTALTNNTDKTVVSISVPVGTWDISPSINFFPAATTNVTSLAVSVSSVNNTLNGANDRLVGKDFPATVFGAPSYGQTIVGIPARIVITTAPATIYLVAKSTFSVSTMEAYGTIQATKVH